MDVIVTKPIHQWRELPIHINEFTEIFFSYITQYVVVGVVESELNDTKVNLLLERLTSWSVEALSTQMTVVGHSWGWAGVPCQMRVDYFCPNFEHCWAIVEVKPIHLYIGLNVGRECWTVLSPNFDTMVHICQYQCPTIVSQKICKTNCKQCQDYLVPCVRPTGIPYMPQTWKYWDLDREAAKKMLDKYEETRPIMKESVYFYLSKSSYGGYRLLAGFDFHAKKHMAIWRKGFGQPPSVVVKDELRVREFLVVMRPHLRNLSKGEGRAFLKNFVRANNITWDESQEILYGNLSLK